QRQDAGRHYPRLDEHLRIFDRHVVVELVPDTGKPLDDAHAARMDEAASSQPGRIVEIDGFDDERIPLPGSYALPIERREVLLQRAQLAAIRRDVAVLVVAAAVI